MKHELRGNFHYDDQMNRRGVCLCDIFTDNDGKKYVVFTELNSNKGPSVTNAIEDIVTIFFETRPDLRPDNVVIVERYEDKPQEFDLVSLTRGDRRFTKPNWSRIAGVVADKLLAAYITLEGEDAVSKRRRP